jgi:hypothetical protein
MNQLKITRQIVLSAMLMGGLLFNTSANAYVLPGITESGFGFESESSISWQVKGNKYSNTGSAKKVDGELFVSDTLSYLVADLTFKLKADHDANVALGPGSFLSGNLQIKGRIGDLGINDIEVLYEADLTSFNFSGFDVDALFGYNTEMTFCHAALAAYCTPAESVYMEIQDGQSFNLDSLKFSANGVQVTTIPVPAAVWLFGSGLIGLLGAAKRKR